MRVSPEFSLKDEDYEFLLTFIKKDKARAIEIKRAQALLLLHNQILATEIRMIFGLGITMIRGTRAKYLKGGLEMALSDYARSGKPKKFSPTDRAKVTALACTEATDGHAKWSLRLLADKLVELKYVDSISKAQVGRILKKTK